MIARAALLLSLASCATVSPKPPPVLAPVHSGQLQVQFIGTSPKDAELFVCGFLDSNAEPSANTLSCIDYVLFMKQLQESGASGQESGASGQEPGAAR